MSKALNLKHFQTFAKQVKGARVGEISVRRESGPKGVRLKYSARDPKSRKIFNGEWVVARADSGEADAAAEREFFEIAEKEFAVDREES